MSSALNQALLDPNSVEWKEFTRSMIPHWEDLIEETQKKIHEIDKIIQNKEHERRMLQQDRDSWARRRHQAMLFVGELVSC